MGSLLRALLASLLVASCASSPAIAGDAVRGEALYNSRCIACHSPDANRVGPKHRGVVGRTAGTVPDFSYSSAVRNSGVVWDERSLDQWLSDPRAFIPGQRMNVKVADPLDRADLIAYLKTLR